MKVIAFYLPQFHPIPENNKWWSPGFTEWTNVARARPLFPGHYQPRIPGELGFYDLRVPETRMQQAMLAKEYGVSAFCYYHYWFNGRLLLERPVEEMLHSGEPKMDFCFYWANESWTANWIGQPRKILMEQTYPGEKDHRRHLQYLAQFFTDNRYVRIDGRPLFLIHRPLAIPNTIETLQLWRSMASKIIGDDLFIVGIGNQIDKILSSGYDGVVTYSLQEALVDYLSSPINRLLQLFRHRVLKWPRWVISYQSLLPHLKRNEWRRAKVFPDVLPNWDNSPRLGRNALVLTDSQPLFFEDLLSFAFESVINREDEYQIIFLKSWNEWAEGNYVEPDLKFGRSFLESLASSVKRYY